MQKIILTVGIVASGKSTWAKEEVKKDPNTIRINRDDLRIMMTNYEYSEENEKLVIATRDHIMLSSLKQGRNVIIDDTNLNRRIFDDICGLVNNAGIQCMVMEKPFFISLNEAIERNAKREGFARIPEDVIQKMWKKSGGDQHKFYKPRMQMCGMNCSDQEMAAQDNKSNPTLSWAILCDLDGTISLFNPIRRNGTVEVRYPGAPSRNPYNAAKADEDMLNEPVAEVLEKMAEAGYQIIFCSGRTEQYRSQTIKFLDKHISFKYQLLMRREDDSRHDEIVKKEIYDNHIRDKFNVLFVFDDRLKVCKMWHNLGIMLFRVGDPCSDF